MNANRSEPITRLLASLRAGDPAAGDRLFPIVYAQLRQLAQRQLAGERGQITLAPTDLVHEAYLKLCDGVVPDAHDRTHFFGLAARAMRQVLVDRARRRDAAKRDGGDRVTLTPDVAAAPGSMIDMLALDQALNALAEVDERKARAIELRVFAGLEFEQIAGLLDISRATLARDYRGAQAWLYRALGPAPANGARQ
jgi:RNA polymerase sigma factor (TIGR02999 family)